MMPFEYERAQDADLAAATVTSRPGAEFLGGGTNLVDHMRLGVTSPDLLVDVTRLPYDTVEVMPDGRLRIGATVRNSDLAAAAMVRRRYPMVTEALVAGASGQVRNLATTAGNLLQRTRCVYFRDVTTPCNKREPGSGCSAIGGYTRYHAILGASPSCVAVHPSDLAVALSALDAVVHVRGAHRDRAVPVDELYRLPGDEPERDTVLEHGDLVTAVDVSDIPMAATSRYRKVRDRASYAFALVSVAAAVDVDGDTVKDVRLALGGVAPKPWRAHAAERMLRGAPASDEAFRAAADAELDAAEPLQGNEFKVAMARNTVVSVLRDLTGGQPE